MEAEKIIEELATLRLRELQEVIAAAQALEQRYLTWMDPRSEEALPKTGSYVQERVRCGKPGCKSCSELGGHGPYWYLHTSENGKTKKKYIGKELPFGATTAQHMAEQISGTTAAQLAEQMSGATAAQQLVDNILGVADAQHLVKQMEKTSAATQHLVEQNPPKRGPGQPRKS